MLIIGTILSIYYARDKRQGRLRFSELQVPVGSTLLFAKAPTITCSVVEDGKVELRGQIMSPSKAALSIVQEMGYNWSAVSGSDYWMYEDETLAVRRLRKEDDAPKIIRTLELPCSIAIFINYSRKRKVI